MKEKIIVIVVILFGFFIIKSNYDFNSNISELKLNGVNIKSLPIEEYVERTKNGKFLDYEIFPKFHVPYVGDFSCRTTLNVETFNLFKQIDTRVFDVRYLPRDPSICDVVGDEDENSWELTIFGIFLIIVSGFYLYNRS